MPTFVNVKKAIKMPRVVSGVRSISVLIKSIKNRTVTSRFPPLGAAGSRLAGQVDVAGLTSLGVPALKSNGKKVVGGV